MSFRKGLVGGMALCLLSGTSFAGNNLAERIKAIQAAENAKLSSQTAEETEEDSDVSQAETVKDSPVKPEMARDFLQMQSIEAYEKLGAFYMTGTGGVTRDVSRALYWYHKAAAAGSSKAMLFLGLAYEKFEEAPIDFQQSFYWYLKAAKAGISVAYLSVSNLYLSGKLGADGAEQAAYWLQKAEIQADPPLLYQISEKILAHPELGFNPLEAVRLLKRASEAGYAPADIRLAKFYLAGEIVEANAKLGEDYYQLAATRGSAEAQYDLAVVYLLNPGLRNSRKALIWVKKAAESYYPRAFYLLGQLYAKGDDAPQSYQRAYQWLELARLSGLTKAEALQDQIRPLMATAEVDQARLMAEKWQKEHPKKEISSPTIQ